MRLPIGQTSGANVRLQHFNALGVFLKVERLDWTKEDMRTVLRVHFSSKIVL